MQNKGSTWFGMHQVYLCTLNKNLLITITTYNDKDKKILKNKSYFFYMFDWKQCK